MSATSLCFKGTSRGTAKYPHAHSVIADVDRSNSEGGLTLLQRTIWGLKNDAYSVDATSGYIWHRIPCGPDFLNEIGRMDGVSSLLDADVDVNAYARGREMCTSA